MKYMLIVGLLVLGLASVLAQNPPSQPADQSTQWKDVWTLSFDGASLDPTKWAGDFKTRMTYIIVGLAAGFFLGLPLTLLIGDAVFLYGAVKLSYLMVGAVTIATAGYHRRNALWMLVGGAASYLLLFGYKWD